MFSPHLGLVGCDVRRYSRQARQNPSYKGHA